MLNAVTAAPAAPAAIHPAATAPAAAAGNAEPGAFARALDRAGQQDGSEAEPADADAQPGPDAAQAATPARARSRVAADGKAGGERKPERSAVAKDLTLADSITGRTPGEKSASHTDPAGPSDLQALLAGLMAHLPTPSHPTAPAAGTAHAARGEAVEAGGGAASGTNGPALPAASPAQPLPQAADAAAAAAATLPAFNLPQAAGTAAAPAPAEAAPPAPVHQAQVSAAVGTPEFAPGLSAEVNVMLRDGLQEARLQLNPAEMGPITVQIQIEGSNAQIHLSAEQAPTRDALEQALPMLAGTLQDSGLTLTGGGVFEQPRPPRDDAPPAARGNSGPSRDGGDEGIPGAVAGAATRRLAPRGVVDLYA